MQYFFVLGKTPVLSLAEISAVIPKFKIIDLSPEILIIETPAGITINCEELMNKLGGVIKTGEIWGKYNHVIINLIVDKLAAKAQIGQKLEYGFSLYKLQQTGHYQELRSQLNKLGLEVKKLMKKKSQVNCRFVVSREDNLSSVVVVKNGLLAKGGDFVIIPSIDNSVYLGQTLAVQDFEAYGNFDYGRPARDDLSGMIPPKLAQIMINLAQIKNTDILLDPFCGSGTILQQAARMGYVNLIGLDNSETAVSNSLTNFSWLIKEEKLIGINYQLEKGDVQNLSSKIKKSSVEAIITEPYLGPPLSGRENPQEIFKNILYLENLYKNSLVEFKKVLKKKGRVVMILPVFYLFGREQRLNIFDAARELLFCQIDLSKNVPAGFSQETRGSIVYRRVGQFVGREIVKFIKL